MSASQSTSSSSCGIAKKLVKSILFSDVKAVEASLPPLLDAPNTDFIASYSYIGSVAQGIGSNVAKIIIPGFPPALARERLRQYGKTLQEDKSNELIDENHLRVPYFPTEPLFRAVLTSAPEFPWKEIQFVTDRNNLRKLCRFIQLERDRKLMDEPFTIVAERVNATTIVLTRQEPCDTGHPAGYGHSFERAFTTSTSTIPELDVSGYRRMITLQLGKLKVLVRSECDAVDLSQPEEGKEDRLSEALQQMKLGNRNSSSVEWVSTPGSTVQHALIGKPEAECKVAVEFKTKSVRQRDFFPWDQVFRQMYFGGVDTLLLGWHNRGTLTELPELLSRNELLHRAGMTQAQHTKEMQLLGFVLEEIKECLSSTEHLHKVFEIQFKGMVPRKLDIVKCEGAPSRVPEWFVKTLS